MVVQHNLQAMNANRMLGITTKQAQSSTEKLSSGYRINRAADDAAGLAISEKMRKQIRGLDQASANAEDGISCVQTAEGAMAEVQDMLQRMNELCVQAANGTNSVTDRQYIQDELDQLVSEINRVAETTKFNETYLLKGDDAKPMTTVYTTNYSSKATANIVSNDIKNKLALDYKVSYKGTNNVVMVGKDILTADSSNLMAGYVVKSGDDITKYMKKGADIGYKKEIKAIPAGGYDIFESDGTTPIDPYDAFEITSEGTLKLKDPSMKFYDDTPAEIPASTVLDNFRVETTGGVEIVLVDTNDKVFAGTNAGAAAEVTTLTDQFYIDGTGKIAVKDPAQKFWTANGGTEITAAEALAKLKTSSLLFDINGNPVTENDVSNYYSSAGEYIGGLYDKTNAEIPAADIDDYVSVKTDADINSNTQNAVFNTDQYVAFVNVELNSNVATGNNGLVAGATAPDSDLSTNGVDEKTRANKDLYVYDSANDTVVHLHAGDEMTKYLNEDNTMNERYRLVDYITSSNTPKSGEHVLKQITNNVDFTWDDNYIQLASGMQKLYDANGTIVSGMKLNEYFDVNGNYTGGLYTTDQARAIDQVFASENSDAYRDLAASGYRPTLIDEYITQSAQSVTASLTVSLQAGSDADRTNKVKVDIDSLTAAGLGIDKLSSVNIGIVDTTGDNATDAITVVADALQKVSRQRSALGAIQNRLEHTIKNLDNVVENTTAAEAQIRDTDMAEEMVRYSNTNILQQAGQSMLAQSNQANQGVLSLLQ